MQSQLSSTIVPELALSLREPTSTNIFRSQVGNWADAFGRELSTRVTFEARPRVLGLFSGAGGLDIGFHDVGFDIVETIEFEPKFVETLEENTGVGRYFGANQVNNCIDVREYNPSVGSIDFIIGGPPCQSFSAAGARASGVAGTKDERGALFREYARLLQTLQPKGFLFENVYRIVGANGGRDWAEIVKAFFDVGYEVRHRILDAADYGTAQHRERLIIVGVRRDLTANIEYQFPRPTHGPDSALKRPHVSAGAVLSGLPQHITNTALKGRYGSLLAEIPPGLNYSYFTERMGHPRPLFAWRSKFSDFLYKADPTRPVRTIKALGGQYTGPFHWDNRPFTVSELKRLQSFPDDYVIHGSKNVQIQQIGNSVPPQLARMLAASVAEQIFGAKLSFELPRLPHGQKLSFRQRKTNLTNHYEQAARRAIALLSDESMPVTIETYGAALKDDFSWNIEETSQSKIVVTECINGTELHIELSTSNGGTAASGWHLYLCPKDDWVLPFSGVHLRSSSFADMNYTALWKAFETFLIRNQLKADLVQLVNYYQYAPSVIIEALSVPDTVLGSLILRLSHGDFVNTKFHIKYIAKEMCLDDISAKSLMLKLKVIGFEVRNSFTNKAIDSEEYLIPYGFPTLTKMSVQRSKALS